MKRTKRTLLSSLLVVSILITGLCIAVLAVKNTQDTRSRAMQADVELILNPTTIQGVVDEETTITVLMNTHTKTVSAVSIHLSYDPSALDIEDVTLTSALPTVLTNPDTENGTIIFTVGSSPDAPIKGVEALASIRIKPRVKKSTAIMFGNATAVAAIESTANVVGKRTGTTIVFTESPTNTPGTIPANPTTTPSSSSSQDDSFDPLVGSHADSSFSEESPSIPQPEQKQLPPESTGWVGGIAKFFSLIVSLVKQLFFPSGK